MQKKSLLSNLSDHGSPDKLGSRFQRGGCIGQIYQYYPENLLSSEWLLLGKRKLKHCFDKQFRSMGLSAQTITEVWEGRRVQRKQAMEQLWKPELTISSDYAFTHRWSRKQKQQALERESNYKHNVSSISGTFPASHSLFLVSCLLVFCPFSCDSITVYRTLFWTGLGTWYNFF